MKIVNKSKGRPSRYLKRYAIEASKLCQLGAIDKDLADFFNVNMATINRWKKAHPEFKKALDESKFDFDSKIELALAKRAMGYDKDGKHYPADVKAIIYFLNNRKPTQWRSIVDKQPPGKMEILVTRK